MKSLDKRASSKHPVSGAPLGERGETFSEFFDPAKKERIVRRFELLAILTMYHKRNRWWMRIWLGIQRYWYKSARAPFVTMDKPKAVDE